MSLSNIILKIKTGLLFYIVISGISLFILDKGYADQITWKQRKELFLKGTITDKKGNTWDVIYLPGVESITSEANSSFKEAARVIKKLATKDFWDNRMEEFKTGLNTSKDVTMNYWIKGIHSDYLEAKEKSASISENEFGGVGGKIATWTKFGVLASGRTVTFPIGVVYGLGVESTLIPLGSIVGTPVWSGVVALGGGIALPGVFYVWNGIAWVATSINKNEPNHENYFIVLKFNKNIKDESLVIDKKGFDTLLMGSIVKALSMNEINSLQKQASEYYSQYLNLSKKQDEKVSELNKNEQYLLLEKLLADAYLKNDVKLNSDSQQILMNEVQLNQLISDCLKEMNVEPREETITQIKQTLKENLKALLKEVNSVDFANIN